MPLAAGFYFNRGFREPASKWLYGLPCIRCTSGELVGWFTVVRLCVCFTGTVYQLFFFSLLKKKEEREYVMQARTSRIT